MSAGTAVWLAAVLVAASLLAFAQAVLRLLAIRNLKATGRFERFGKPQRFMWLDALPIRLFFRDGEFDAAERRMFRRYFLSWVGAWVAFALHIYGSVVAQA